MKTDKILILYLINFREAVCGEGLDSHRPKEACLDGGLEVHMGIAWRIRLNAQ